MKHLPLIIFLCLILTACNLSSNALDGTRWSLQSLNGRELQASRAITLEFDDETVSGSSGCNTFDAKYDIGPKNSFEVSESRGTLIECTMLGGEIDLMEQEDEYLSALHSVTHYKISGNTLSLTNEKEDILLLYQRD